VRWLNKNPHLNSQPVRTSRRHPYGAEYGQLASGAKVVVVRYGAMYVATNRLTRPAAEARRVGRVRAQIEEVI
jgi:hypothetical protein